MAQPNGLSAEQVALQLQQLAAGLAESRNREEQLRTRVEQLLTQQQQQQVVIQQQQQQLQGQASPQSVDGGMGEAILQLTRSQQELVEALKVKESRKINLVDTKGLSKPDRFSGSEEGFLYWRTRLEGFVTSIVPELEDVMSWAEEQEFEITRAMVEAAWGDGGTEGEIDELESWVNQLYSVLQTLCEKEAFTIVRSAGKNMGLEAWRKLVRRYDPSTGGRRRAMLKHILNPPKCGRVEDLSMALETWEEQLRQYESRKRADGTRHQVDEEIKIAILEHLCPAEIERHLQLNRTRYTGYNDVRAELVTYLETRLGQKLKIYDANFSGDPNGVQPMDVSGFDRKGKGKDSKGKGKSKKGGKGKGHGSGKGKGGKPSKTGATKDDQCRNCGKYGHYARDCWSAGGGAANKGQKPKGDGKKNKSQQKSGGKGKKGVNNLEEQQEPEAEGSNPLDTGYLSIAGLDVKEEEDRGREESSESPLRPYCLRHPRDVWREPEWREMERRRSLNMPTDEATAEDCPEPCEHCYIHPCAAEHFSEHDHICVRCREDRKNPSSVRTSIDLYQEHEFEYVIDRTICLRLQMSPKKFYQERDAKFRDKHRDVVDPTKLLRLHNWQVITDVEAWRKTKKEEFLNKVYEGPSGSSQTFGQAGTGSSDSRGLSQPSGLAELPARPMGTSSSTLMHRTIESTGLSNLVQERREKIQELEEAEDEDTSKAIEDRIKTIDIEISKLKSQIKSNDEAVKKVEPKKQALTKESLLSQEWHDARYHAERRAGVSHSAAWAHEKKRRKATLHRQEGSQKRAVERKRLDDEWHAEFDSKPVKEEEFQDDVLEGVETEAVEVLEEGGIRVFTGETQQVSSGSKLKPQEKKRFMKSKKKYRRLTEAELSKFKEETKVDEQAVMKKKRVDMFARRNRLMNSKQKQERKARIKAAQRRKSLCRHMLWHGKCTTVDCQFSHDPELLKNTSKEVCGAFVRGVCKRGVKCKMHHDHVEREILRITRRQKNVSKVPTGVVLKDNSGVEVKQEINSFGGEWSENGQWIVANFDTGAAITAIPKRLGSSFGAEVTEPNGKEYKTASGELLSDQGGILLKGFDKYGQGRSLKGRLTDVHRTLVAGSAVTKQNLVVLDGDHGMIIPSASPIAEGLRSKFQQLQSQFPEDANNMTEMYEKNGIFLFDLWVNQDGDGNGSGSREELGAVGSGFKRQARP